MPKKTYTIKDWSGGVNKVNSPSNLEENESDTLSNFTSNNKGNLRLGGDYTRGSLTGMTGHTFTPGEGLHLGLSDYTQLFLEAPAEGTSTANKLPKKAAWFEATGTDWTVDANGSGGAGVTLADDQGCLYLAGSANYQKHFLKYNTAFVKQNSWYQFYLLFNQTTGTAIDAWDGHIDLFLGNDPTSTSTYSMLPQKYRHRHAATTPGGGVGGIYISPGHDANSTPWSPVTSEGQVGMQCFAAGICKTPSFGAGLGHLFIFGHPNGTTTSGMKEWTLAHIQIREIVQDNSAQENAKGDMFFIGGDKVQHYNGVTTRTIDFLNAKRSDFDASGATATGASIVQTSEVNQTNMYQADSLMRVSDGNFDNDVSSRLYGPIVREEKDDFPSGAVIATSSTTPRGPYVPQIRQWYQGQQNINSVWPRDTIQYHDDGGGVIGNGYDNSPLNVFQHNNDMTSTAKELDDIFHMSFFGAPTISVHQGVVADGDIDVDWKKKWHFGISYRLIDNSYTKVFNGYHHDGDASVSGTYVPLGTIISKPGFLEGIHATNYKDAILTDKTIHSIGGAHGLHTGSISGGDTTVTQIDGCTIYCKNHMVVGVKLPDTFSHSEYVTSGQRYPAQGSKFEIRQDALDGGGGVTVFAEGFIYARNNHALNDSLDMTGWAYSPSITLGFRYNTMDPKILLDGDRTGANDTTNGAFGPYIANQMDSSWYRTGRIGGLFNDCWDPRINGFVVWAYAEENASMDTATPWSPIIEVDLDKKTFIPYTFDGAERSLIRNDNFNFNHHFGACYHLGDDFTLGGAHHHEQPPSPIASLTYGNLVGYSPSEEHYLRWKASAVINGRAVIGNIMRGTAVFPDKLAVSYPLTYDAFPDDGTGNIGLNDGEDIIDMAAFGDKLLVFKPTKMYLLDFSDPTSGGSVLDSYDYMGVPHTGMVAVSDYGVSWISPTSGVHHFNGESFKELTAGKLHYDDLGSGLTNNILWASRSLDQRVLLGYESLTKTLHIRIDASSNNNSGLAAGVKSLDGWVYDFKTEDFYLAAEAYGHATANNVAQSNFINTKDSKLHAYITNNTGIVFPVTDTGNTNSLLSVDPRDRYQPSATRLAKYVSRETDFGDPTLKKRVYKVIIKYQSGRNVGGSNGGYTCTYFTNGNGTDPSDALAFTSGTNTLTDNSGEWKVHELIPNVPAEATDIHTIQIGIDSIAHAETGKFFTIDSISIIYRLWHAK